MLAAVLDKQGARFQAADEEGAKLQRDVDNLRASRAGRRGAPAASAPERFTPSFPSATLSGFQNVCISLADKVE